MKGAKVEVERDIKGMLKGDRNGGGNKKYKS